AVHRVARQAWPRVGRDGDEEFRRAVLGDAVGRRRRVAPAAVALALHADGISAERQVGLQRERLVGRAERRYGDGRVLEDAAPAAVSAFSPPGRASPWAWVTALARGCPFAS